MNMHGRTTVFGPWKAIMKPAYVVLAVLGALLPLSAIVPWLATNGWAPDRFVEELFANLVSTFFALDVIVSAFALFVFAAAESREGRLRRPWIPVLATLFVGVSFGLPLLLLLRRDPDAR